MKQVFEPIPRPDSHFEGTSSLKAEGPKRAPQTHIFDSRSPEGHRNPPSYPPKQMYAPAHQLDRPSLPVSPSPRLFPPGRDRFSSLPPPGRGSDNRGNVFHLRSSISNVNLHAPAPRSRIDLDTDRLARACGQDALSASTSFSGGVSTLGVTLGDWWVPVPAHTADSRDRNPHTLEAINKAPIPPPRHFPFPDLEVTIQLLDAELNKHDIWLGEHINIEDVLLGKSPSDTTFSYGAAVRRQEPNERHYVFGSALENLDPRLMTSTLLGGYLHDVPLLVSQCIGELYRTGMYQPGLFRTLPDRSRLHRLIRQFDNSVVEPFNALHTIASETTSNVCALLLEYIAALPDPLLPRSIFNALWEWCIVPASSYETSICRSLSSSEGRSRSKNGRKGCNGGPSYPEGDVRNAPSDKTCIDQTRGRRPGSYTIGPSSMGSRLPYYVSRSALDAQLREAESSQIQITQYLLLLIPRRSLSLLLYLLSFFSQLPLSPENGMTFDDVARIFAHSLLGGPSEGASRVMMVWLLNRSSRLLEKFEPTEDDSASTSSDLSSLFSSPSSRCSSATDAYPAKFRQDAAKEKALRRQLSSVIQERDKAIRMVREMKRVVNPDSSEFRPRTV
ncbi:Rho GTPase activation protein [Panus rudis PR-1116 ss-1]|nr:Rho GTPase activation protein [Panus rudis PR-1116 ss-1]